MGMRVRAGPRAGQAERMPLLLSRRPGLLSRLSPAVRASVLDAVSVLFPIDCAGCGAPDRALCASCLAGLVPRQEHRELADGTTVFTGLRYDGVARQTILSLKRQGRTDVAGALAAPIAGAVAAALRSTAHDAVELVAVPSSRAAFRRRGYDPVLLVLRRAGLLPSARVLVSVREHAQQKMLDRDARQLNLAGTMLARHPLGGRAFIVVDDVVTTGATLMEAARAIRSAGGEVLCAVALANTVRTLGDFEGSRHKLVTSPDDGTTVSKRGALVRPGSAGGDAPL